MREVLAFWVVAPARSEIRTRPYAEFDDRNLDEFAELRGRNTTREFRACEVRKRLVRPIEEGALGSQASTSLRVVLRENQVAWSAYDAPLG